VAANPIVVNGVAVVNGSVCGISPTTVFALNARTGEKIWVNSHLLGKGQGTFEIHPQVADGWVYLASAYGSGPGGGVLLGLTRQAANCCGDSIPFLALTVAMTLSASARAARIHVVAAPFLDVGASNTSGSLPSFSANLRSCLSPHQNGSTACSRGRRERGHFPETGRHRDSALLLIERPFLSGASAMGHDVNKLSCFVRLFNVPFAVDLPE
jgi:hypothetical protein